ncbi:MAG: T9SS type A sorting domain-containing protein [Bacteroidota bacterium]
MKNIRITIFLLFISAGLFSQNTLTYRNNALLPGDSSSFREIQFVDPGNAGPNQIWDFSKIEYTGKNLVSQMQPPSALKTAGVDQYNLLLSDAGYDYFMNTGETFLEERGYVNKQKKMTMSYSDPLLKMKYPFSYGDQFSDPFTGVAFFNENYRIDFGGNYTAAADAYGTLILPDMVIKNTLRVKSVKNGLQINMCGSVEVNITKYFWYAQGFRYPVMTISIVENRYGGKAPEITKTAYVNTGQQHDNGAIAGTNNSNPQVDKSDFSVIVFPNPFKEKLTYNYFLRKQLPVSIEIYDMSGKYNARLLKNQVQTEGLHTGELDGMTNGLTPGVYYIRFTFDKQVIINKVVKI